MKGDTTGPSNRQTVSRPSLSPKTGSLGDNVLRNLEECLLAYIARRRNGRYHLSFPSNNYVNVDGYYRRLASTKMLVCRKSSISVVLEVRPAT